MATSTNQRPSRIDEGENSTFTSTQQTLHEAMESKASLGLTCIQNGTGLENEKEKRIV